MCFSLEMYIAMNATDPSTYRHLVGSLTSIMNDREKTHVAIDWALYIKSRMIIKETKEYNNGVTLSTINLEIISVTTKEKYIRILTYTRRGTNDHVMIILILIRTLTIIQRKALNR